jgi:Nif-specific regulatory protein
VDGLERALIEEVMRECGGTQIKAAERLGINRNTLHKKWEQYKADAPTAPQGPVRDASSARGGEGDERKETA